MLKTDLLMYRFDGETIIPKKLPLSKSNLFLACEQIDCFQTCVGKTQGYLENKLKELEGDSPDYRLKRGLAHLLKNHFSTFEVISPLMPSKLREMVFSYSANSLPIPDNKELVLSAIALNLSKEVEREVLPQEIEQGLYADLQENRILTNFETPQPETLIHRYNLSQVQGIFYRASEITIHAHRNQPGEYKQLFRYLKLFELMVYVEGDADTGFTITMDGPTSLFKANTRYGLALAKMIPALLHVRKWSLEATLRMKDNYTNRIKEKRFHLDDNCDLVSHYGVNTTYDSLLEESFARRWEKLDTPWRLEREVDLLPVPGSVMIPDFRIVHPDGRDFLLEIVGYWSPQYLQKKFYQAQKVERDNLILAISERLNLAKAGVNFQELPNKIVWFKNKLSPQDVLSIIDRP